MSASSTQQSRPPRSIPRWLAYLLFALVWGVIPWALSLLGQRHGWEAGRPGVWNLLGLIPLAAGIAGSLWGLGMHTGKSGPGVDFEPEKSYLLTDGPYAFSRNPMYLFELTLMFGWVVFYGSLAVLAGFLLWWAFFNFYQIPSEERTIEAHFGETYRDYQRRVPRWLGRPRR